MARCEGGLCDAGARVVCAMMVARCEGGLCDAGARVVGSTSVVGDAGTWLFYIVVAALLSILVLSVVVIVLWKRVDSGRHDCAIARLLYPYEYELLTFLLT